MHGNPVFMQQAIALATESVESGRGGPFGAVIVRDGEVIATGSTLVTANNDPTAHAEVVAIRNACASVLGGSSPGGASLPSEVWDLGTHTVTVVTGSAVSRHDHAATLLPDGRVLITGGVDEANQPVEHPSEPREIDIA